MLEDPAFGLIDHFLAQFQERPIDNPGPLCGQCFMNPGQLTFLGYGVLIGLAVTAWVAFNGWQRRRLLEAELQKLRAHLQVHMEITHEGSAQLREDAEQLRQQNENLRVTLKAWQQKPDRRELRALEVYERAVRQLQASAPGFAVHWENALREAEQTLERTDRGLLAFARRLFVLGPRRVPSQRDP